MPSSLEAQFTHHLPRSAPAARQLSGFTGTSQSFQTRTVGRQREVRGGLYRSLACRGGGRGPGERELQSRRGQGVSPKGVRQGGLRVRPAGMARWVALRRDQGLLPAGGATGEHAGRVDAEREQAGHRRGWLEALPAPLAAPVSLSLAPLHPLQSGRDRDRFAQRVASTIHANVLPTGAGRRPTRYPLPSESSVLAGASSLHRAPRAHRTSVSASGWGRGEGRLTAAERAHWLVSDLSGLSLDLLLTRPPGAGWGAGSGVPAPRGHTTLGDLQLPTPLEVGISA